MSTASPAHQLALLDLQGWDTRASQIEHKRRAMPELVTIAELDGQIADLDTALVTSNTAVSDLRREVAKAEADVQQVRTRAERDQALLDAGTGTSKDLMALQSELASLAKRRSDLEDVELEIMERLEAHEGAASELSTAKAALVQRKDELLAVVGAASAELDVEAAAVAAKRAEIVAGLPADLVERYEKLRARFGGVAVAALRHGVSEASGMPLAPTEIAKVKALEPDELYFCEDSGRILVRGEDAF